MRLDEFLNSDPDARLLERVWEALPDACRRRTPEESVLAYQCQVCRPAKLFARWLIRRALIREALR